MRYKVNRMINPAGSKWLTVKAFLCNRQATPLPPKTLHRCWAMYPLGSCCIHTYYNIPKKNGLNWMLGQVEPSMELRFLNFLYPVYSTNGLQIIPKFANILGENW